ncbi:MAG: two component transcriptional regulator [Cyanobacteria bacterium RYN_339]|nr:two component transcriptional regulator [Cyanobacteria bacterium RYN_339]
MTRRLLLIDDDTRLARLLQDFLGEHGYELDRAGSATEGVGLLARRPELVLLDVMLPGQDGFGLCERLRAAGHGMPILMISGRGGHEDRVRGLKLGADDYLSKPFNPEELLARIEAVLRRSPVVTRRDDRLDRDRRVLVLDGRELTVTPMEYRLLEVLTAAPGRVFTRDELLSALDLAGAMENSDRAIDLHVSRLRAKVEPDARRPRHLITVRGQGYRFEW